MRSALSKNYITVAKSLRASQQWNDRHPVDENEWQNRIIQMWIVRRYQRISHTKVSFLEDDATPFEPPASRRCQKVDTRRNQDEMRGRTNYRSIAQSNGQLDEDGGWRFVSLKVLLSLVLRWEGQSRRSSSEL